MITFSRIKALSLDGISAFVLENYYVILVCIYFSSIYIPAIRTGVTMAAIMLFLIVTRIKMVGIYSGAVSLYVAYSLFSMQGYMYNGVPFSLYVEEFTAQMLPVSFFFLAILPETNVERFYKKTMFALLFAIVVGFYYYEYSPSEFVRYMVTHGTVGYEGELEREDFMIRFSSIFGSIVTGTISCYLLILSLFCIVGSKDAGKKTMTFYSIIFIISIASSMMTQQRSSMVMSIFIVAFAFCYLNMTYSESRKRINLLLVLVAISCLLYTSNFSLYTESIAKRFDEVGMSTYDSRSDQWIGNFENNTNIVLGTGLGSASPRAMDYVKNYIADGYLFKIIAEFGIVGFALFMYIICSIAIRSRHDFGLLMREYLVILLCLFQSTGSNTLSFQAVAPLFWFCLGVMERNNRKITNNE